MEIPQNIQIIVNTLIERFQITEKTALQIIFRCEGVAVGELTKLELGAYVGTTTDLSSRQRSNLLLLLDQEIFQKVIK